MKELNVITVRVKAERFDDFIGLIERGALRRIEASVRFIEGSTFLDPNGVDSFTIELWNRTGVEEALDLSPEVEVLRVLAEW